MKTDEHCWDTSKNVKRSWRTDVVYISAGLVHIQCSTCSQLHTMCLHACTVRPLSHRTSVKKQRIVSHEECTTWCRFHAKNYASVRFCRKNFLMFAKTSQGMLFFSVVWKGLNTPLLKSSWSTGHGIRLLVLDYAHLKLGHWFHALLEFQVCSDRDDIAPLTLLLLVPFSYKLKHHLEPFAIMVLNCVQCWFPKWYMYM